MEKNFGIKHLVALLILFTLFFSTSKTAAEKDGLLKIYFLDVGQGDAIFAEAPNGNQVLIDGGPDNKVLAKLGEIMPFYDRDIDVVVLSHRHADHLVGLIEVLKRYEIKNIVSTKDSYDSPESKEWDTAVLNEKANEIEPLAGKFIDLGSGVRLAILYPPESLNGQTSKNPNNNSVIMRIDYGNARILFTGDVEAKVQEKLVLTGTDLDSDVLKIPHHGSRNSFYADFIAAVSPQVAFIEVGKDNVYNFPSSDVISNLENFKIKYYRSDLDSDTELITDGKTFKINKI